MPTDLDEQLIDAIKDAVEQLTQQHEGDLFGFALCTDDSVSSLYPIASSKSWTDEKEELKYAIWPPEWTCSVQDKDAFNTISKKLFAESGELTESGPWSKARDARFQRLVQAVLSCKKAGELDAFSYLCVTSSSPGNHMLKLTKKAIRALNSETYSRAFKAFLG